MDTQTIFIFSDIEAILVRNQARGSKEEKVIMAGAGGGGEEGTVGCATSESRLAPAQKLQTVIDRQSSSFHKGTQCQPVPLTCTRKRCSEPRGVWVDDACTLVYSLSQSIDRSLSCTDSMSLTLWWVTGLKPGPTRPPQIYACPVKLETRSFCFSLQHHAVGKNAPLRIVGSRVVRLWG